MQSGIFRVIGKIMVVLAHLAAYVVFRIQAASLPLPERWNAQVLFMLGLSLIIGVAFSAFKNRIVIFVLLVFRGMLLIAIGMSQAECVGMEFILTLGIILDACIYLSIWEGVFYSVIFTGTVVGIQLFPVTAWGVRLALPATVDLWSYGVLCFFQILFCALLRMQHEAQLPVTEVRTHYQGALQRLGHVNMQLQEYAATVQQETLINERKRLGREIHDTLAYTLTNLVMMLEAAKLMTDRRQSELIHYLERIHAQAGEGLDEVHRVLHDLRPSLLNEGAGLAAIKHLVDTFTNATDIKITLNLGNAPLSVGEELDLVIYRFVQEGITNALRHGHASQIEISFSVTGERMHIQIRDNGIGIDEPQIGYGLSGMRERIERIGGRLEFFGAYGLGFCLLAILPV